MQKDGYTHGWKRNKQVNRRAQEMRLGLIKEILHFQESGVILIVVNGQTVSKIRKVNLLQRKLFYPEHPEVSKEDWR